MSEQPPQPGWWQSPDGGWHPPKPSEDELASVDSPAGSPSAFSPFSEKGCFRWIIASIVVFGLLFAWVVEVTGEDDVTYDGFLEEVTEGASCEDLFDYRNDLRREIPSTTDALNAQLQRIGCSSSTSQRTDR